MPPTDHLSNHLGKLFIKSEVSFFTLALAAYLYTTVRGYFYSLHTVSLPTSLTALQPQTYRHGHPWLQSWHNHHPWVERRQIKCSSYQAILSNSTCNITSSSSSTSYMACHYKARPVEPRFTGAEVNLQCNLAMHTDGTYVCEHCRHTLSPYPSRLKLVAMRRIPIDVPINCFHRHLETVRHTNGFTSPCSANVTKPSLSLCAFVVLS